MIELSVAAWCMLTLNFGLSVLIHGFHLDETTAPVIVVGTLMYAIAIVPGVNLIIAFGAGIMLVFRLLNLVHNRCVHKKWVM